MYIQIFTLFESQLTGCEPRFCLKRLIIPEVEDLFLLSPPIQMGLQRWWEQEIPVDGTINKGELMTHNLTELIKPESYEVRLTPITRFGEGDSTIRIITYSGTLHSSTLGLILEITEISPGILQFLYI